MTPEQWEQTKRMFLAALEREPALRSDFLVKACAGDATLRREVESLLEAHEGGEDFIEAPAADVAAALLSENQTGLAAGQMVGPFRVEKVVARGGMGEVYLAGDTRLGRRVALKFLPPQFTSDTDRVRRFEREARASSALNHPNILTVYEIGHADSLHYIAAEFVEGETLRQHLANTRMAVGEVLDVAAQIATALQAAHEAGVVHRDVKPENVMLRPDGYVKVLDFGIAKLNVRDAAIRGGDSEVPTQALLSTSPGVVMGTAHYMSPEQARGQAVDARTDVWSLGVVLYEMTSGRAPFVGDTPSHILVSIMEGEPPLLSLDAEVPAGLERIILKALRKERAERYQTAGEMALELKSLKEELAVEARLKHGHRRNANGEESAAGGDGFGMFEAVREPARTGHVIPGRATASARYLVGEINRHRTFAGALLVLLAGAIGLTYLVSNRNKAHSGAGGKKSVAVLPLNPINAANRDEVYVIGIADSLIHRLSSLKGVVVRPLSATRKYADTEQDPLAAGKEQQVDYVLVSNYQLADGRIRVTAQLIDVVGGQIEDTYKIEKGAGDLFGMQDAVANEFGNRLMARFAPNSSTPASRRGTTNEGAYRLYLQGRNLTMKRSAANTVQAIKSFEEAIRLDPQYALAYAGLAGAYLNSRILQGGVTRDAPEKAVDAARIRELLNQALALDGNLAGAYTVRADLELVHEWNFAAAENDLRRAIELEPNNDSAHWVYALLLAYRGRFDEALEEVETAQEIDPGAVMYMRDRGRFLYYARRYDEAIVQLRRVLELDENLGSAYGWLWRAYEMKGESEAAYEIFMKGVKKWSPDRADIYQGAYETAGWRGVKQKQIEFFKANEQKPEMSFYWVAAECGLLGDTDQAFAYLHKAVERREYQIISLSVEPTLDVLRADPRFAELVSQVALK